VGQGVTPSTVRSSNADNAFQEYLSRMRCGWNPSMFQMVWWARKWGESLYLQLSAYVVWLEIRLLCESKVLGSNPGMSNLRHVISSNCSCRDSNQGHSDRVTNFTGYQFPFHTEIILKSFTYSSLLPLRKFHEECQNTLFSKFVGNTNARHYSQGRFTGTITLGGILQSKSP